MGNSKLIVWHTLANFHVVGNCFDNHYTLVNKQTSTVTVYQPQISPSIPSQNSALYFKRMLRKMWKNILHFFRPAIVQTQDIPYFQDHASCKTLTHQQYKLRLLGWFCIDQGSSRDTVYGSRVYFTIQVVNKIHVDKINEEHYFCGCIALNF